MRARAALAALGVSEFVALIPGSASAAATTALCVPTTENSAVKTPLNNGTCVNTKNENSISLNCRTSSR
jgi:hypothetical protein